MGKLIIGTRNSQLARAQTEMVAQKISKYYPDFKQEICTVTTSGDRQVNKSITEIEGKGLFIKELEQALHKNKIDLAVHSLKDVPPKINSLFELVCFPVRSRPEDVFVGRNVKSLADLAPGAVLGTGSARRRAQIQRFFPDINVTEIRGNVDTRLEKMKNQKLDGLILAAAGLWRMDKKKIIDQHLSLKKNVPAAGQGTLVIEILRERKDLKKRLRKLNDKQVQIISLAERSFMEKLGGSCQLPLGVYARFSAADKAILQIRGFLAFEPEKIYITEEIKAEITSDEYSNRKKAASSLGYRLADKIEGQLKKVNLKQVQKYYQQQN